MNEAVQANEQVEMIFIINPMKPVPLTVKVSTEETIAAIVNAANGPYRKPPIVIIMSAGSYFRNSTTGMRPNIITT